MSALGLPPIPAELRTISPYLQRADELIKKDTIMAYWCAYYAAQVGISLRIKDTPSRDLLFGLLALLERLKKEIGPTDALDVETVSVAYVENFALKVFGMADNEDRKGEATRATAKKFLAAANFLEVLKIFPESDVSESTEDKIKYAKWKAADIAKAFREGRQPRPGPAGSETELAQTSLDTITPNQDVTVSLPETPSPPTSSKRIFPPPHMSPEDIAHANLPCYAIRDLGPSDDISASPGRWSTTATPGFDLEVRTPITTEVIFNDTQDTPLNCSNSPPRNAWVSEDVEGASRVEELMTAATETVARKQVHFAPANHTFPSPPASPARDMIAPVAVASVSEVMHTPEPPPSQPNVSISPALSHSGGGSRISQDIRANITHGLSMPSRSPPHTRPYPLPIETVREPPPATRVGLTPAVIAKAQKHCRFAISALDYEDAAQARKELRAALAMLGE